MELTAEQLAVVAAGDIDIAVTAGAGSGKTHVLVQRYVALLERCRIPEIAAVTFTEAAATEMRQRVRAEVLRRDELARHRPDVDEAVIGTIHGFCLGLLRDHPVEAGIDPASVVLAEDEAELLRRAASADALDEAATVDDERVHALRAVGVYHLNQLLAALVAERDDVRSAFASLDAGGSLEAGIRSLLDARCAEIVAPLRERARGDLDAALAWAVDPADRLVQAVEAAAALCRTLHDDPWDEWAGTAGAAVSALNFNPGSRHAWTVGKPAAVEHLRGLRDEARRCLNSLPRWNDDDLIAVAATAGLRSLFEDACRRYEAAKAERGGIDFLDLELHAVRLLDLPAVREATRRRFRHLMVDEAQDVSPLQARLIRQLVDGPAGGPLLLLVGDEKQSIYGFRGADVRQFRELQRLVRLRGGIEVNLSRSFRTHDGLVAHTNELFSSVFMSLSAGDGSLTMTSMTGRPSAPPHGPHLVVSPIRKGGEENRQRRLVEAALVAAEIETLLNSGRPVWDKRLGGYRPAAAGDIAVLLRRFGNVHLFEQALEARGISYATPSGTGFFGRQEVLDLENLLRWLAESQDDIALAAVLRSPLFILSDAVLFALRLRGPELLAALHHPPDGLAEQDRARCLLAAGILDDLRSRARIEPPVDLLERALQVTGFEASWAPIAGGEQALANIRKLVRIVRSLAGFTLAQVAEYLQQRREELDAREGPAVLDHLDAVQIMTVHGAKGLEFPVVFVPEAHTSVRDLTPVLLWRSGEGLSFTLEADEDDDRRGRPGFYSYLRSQTLADDREEHLRLFYVAATRAGDYLYVSGDAAQNDGWLRAVEDLVADGALEGCDFRDPVDPLAVDIVRRSVPFEVLLPRVQRDYTPPLLARPPVIPLRSSTPVTALRLDEHRHHGAAASDGLGLLRGRIAHRAIEARFGGGPRLEVAAIAHQEAPEASLQVRATLTAEVEAMIDRFEASDIAAELRGPGAGPLFEVPFAWDWEGVPVHGQIDLLYRAAGRWRVVDFKTDRVAGLNLDEVARPYLVQIGLYARAIQAATGARPAAGLLFLRDGRWHEPPDAEVDAALLEARTRIDAGLMLDPELAEYLGGHEDSE